MKIRALILKILVLFIVLIALDFWIGKTLRDYYFKQKFGEYYVLTRTIENPKQQRTEILIMGSSRAKRHYNPEIISETLGMSCYNAGHDAQTIIFHKALLDIIADKYKPEIILLDVISNELEYAGDNYDHLSVLLPYVRDYPELWSALSLKSPFERIKCLSQIYPYNSLLDKIVGGNIIPREIDVNGFTPFYGWFERDLEEMTFSPDSKLDPNKVNAFNSFLTVCREKNIQLYVVYSPEFRKFSNYSSSMNYFKKEAEKQGVEFISYRNDESFFDKDLFREPLHLNNIGAEKFSLDIAIKIKIKNKTNGK
jgi:hypothetical protein